MKRISYSRFALPAILVAGLVAPVAALTWSVADDGTTTCIGQGAGDGKNHTIHNNGADSSVAPTAYDSHGSWSSDGTIGVGSDIVLLVPQSGALKVLDPADEDTDGASGTFTN